MRGRLVVVRAGAAPCRRTQRSRRRTSWFALNDNDNDDNNDNDNDNDADDNVEDVLNDHDENNDK